MLIPHASALSSRAPLGAAGTRPMRSLPSPFAKKGLSWLTVAPCPVTCRSVGGPAPSPREEAVTVLCHRLVGLLRQPASEYRRFYVTETGTRDGAIADGGVHVAYASTDGGKAMKCKSVNSAAVCLLLLLLAPPTAQGQTVLTQTTWGGVGSDAAEGVASAADGSSYVVGITDSFTTDQFGQPSPKIFVVKFAPDGSLTWQRIWNGTTIRGLGRPDVAVSADGSVYVTGITADNQNDAVLLKFDASGTLLWERAWGGAASDEGLAVATASDGSVYIAGTATSFGPSSAGLFVVKFDSAGNLVWQRISDGAEGNAVAVAPDGSVYAAGTTPRNQIGNFDMVVLKITAAGSLVWQRTYSAGEVVDPRGRMAAGSDGSIVMAGAIQAAKAGLVDLAGLIVKLTSDGALVFDKQFAGKVTETGEGGVVAPDGGTLYVAGTTHTL